MVYYLNTIEPFYEYLIQMSLLVT
ncbi:uncharacterized protein METZ01_LOCUS422825, partial [marine metagenome]